MTKKKKRKKQKKNAADLYGEEFGQDEHFFFIAGFTDGGAPYGITWEEAYADGLVEEDEEDASTDLRGKRDESLPF